MMSTQPNRQVYNDFLLGIGHPLLDVSINVDDKFLAKYVFISNVLFK